MRSVSLRLLDMKNHTIPLGFEGENEFTKVRIDCKTIFDQHPTAVPTLAVTDPAGNQYPAVIVRDGDIVEWTVTASDLTAKGDGEIQLIFTVDSDVIGKSDTAKTRVLRSITPSGEIPSGIENFIEQAGEVLGEVQQALVDIPTTIDTAVDTALEQAKESGEFDGADGKDGKDGTDGKDGADGKDGKDGADGAPGADGYSPSASVTKSGKVATITITDKNGTTTETVSDGADGQDGQNGQDGQDGQDGTSAYVYIRYSANEPTADSDMKSEPDAWMGIYSGSSSTAPTAYTSYTWYKIKGENGGGGGSVTVDDELSNSSTNPVQNKVIAEQINSLSSAIEQLNDALTETVDSEEDISSLYVSGKSISTNVGIGNTVNLTPNTSGQYGYLIDENCEPGTVYTVKGTGGNNVRLWAFVDSSDKLLSISDAYAQLNNGDITAPANAAKAIFNMDSSAAHKVRKSINKTVAIDVSAINNSFDKSPQLFDRYTITEGKKYSDGTTADDSKYCLSDFIPVDSETNYTYLNIVGSIVYFGTDKAYLSATTIESIGTAATKATPSSAKYVRLQMDRTFYPYALTSMIKGSAQAKNVDYGELLKPEKINQKLYQFSPAPIPTEYNAVGVKAMDGTVDFDDDNPSLSDLYDAYDALVESYPDYVSKEDLGTDASGTYHLYAYYFTPEEPDVQNTFYRLPYPKINLLSGIHGNGTSGDSNVNCFCLYYLMKSLCDSWRDSDALAYLRWNVRFAVLPVQNPWGFVNKNRCNYNGVDLNKNFSAGWAAGGSGTAEYSGTAPLSEAESVIINAFAEANKDAIFSTDMHSQGQVVTQASMTYTGVYPNSPMWYVARALVTTMTKVWDDQNIPNLSEMDFHGIVHSSVNGGGTQQAHMWAIHGIPSMTLEGFKNFSSSSYSDDSEEIAKMVADQLGYYLLLGLRYFKDNQ